ncbi:hypothetical protein [Opitutus sp. ER46]|uniref:hypothetical protein n=1 Tax=Opitutus sp. ER46 TaxID=2161864 RepID=UPI000D32346C|nr:hypothetical protein [Opitutus sp. ER46]PTX91343.1 hypothetical protein DB354_15715 [Opitutus sp. ER46]
MNLPAFLTLGSLVLTAAGCASSPASPAARGPDVKPGLIILTAQQAEQRGLRVIGPADAASAGPPAVGAAAVATPASLKAYTINRAVDAGDPDLMHEEHVVYRRETAPQWRLDVGADQKILVGPRLTDGRQDLQPLLSKELVGYLNDQRRAVEANDKAIATLIEAVESLTRSQQALIRERQAAEEDEDAEELGDETDAGTG